MMKEQDIKWANEKAYSLVSKLELSGGRCKSKSKIKSLRIYLEGGDMTNFVKNATYFLLRSGEGGSNSNFLKTLLDVIIELRKNYPVEKKQKDVLCYVIGYVSQSMDSIENLYKSDETKFRDNLSNMLQAEFGEERKEIVESIMEATKHQPKQSGRRY